MRTKKVEKISLYHAIRSAFQDVPYPGDQNIGSPEGRDDGEAVTELFLGKDWRSLNPRELWPLALYFMTPQAFHYYFPAYLLAANEKGSGDVIEFVIAVLTPGQGDPYRQTEEDFRKMFGRFTSAQKDAVRLFIDYILAKLISYQQETGDSFSDEEASLRALREYWKTY